jgi:site-specific DNA recombinase
MSIYQSQATASSVMVIPVRARTDRNEQNLGGQKKRIGVYVRVSTELESQASSYGIQVSYFKEYVGRNPQWELFEIFSDEGISGTSTKNRDGFNRMIECCKNKEIDYIITKSISRFARNTLDCLHYIRMLKGLGIGIYFQKENLDTLDSKSELFLTILSSMAQEESRSISENTKWGVQKRFQQGIVHMPTTYFLGYDTDEDGNIIIDEKQAKVVRRIFRDFLSGKGTPLIAKGLTEDGVSTARGNTTWTSDAVYKILKNEKYMGDCLAQKTVTLDFLTHKRVRNKDHQPQFLVKNNHPAIISEEDWNAVQQELKRRSKMQRDPDGKYSMRYSGKATFSNKLFCGECQRPVIRRRLTTHTKNREKVPFTAWQCRSAARLDKEFKGCKSQYIWEVDLEKEFMRLLIELKGKKDRIIEEANLAIEEYSLTEAEEARLEELKTQIGKITDRISEMAAREPSRNDPIYDATMQHLMYEQEILQIEFERLNENNQDSIYLKNHLDELLKYIDEIEEDDEEKFRDDIFSQTVEKGILYKNHRVEIYFKCGVTCTIWIKHEKRIVK